MADTINIGLARQQRDGPPAEDWRAKILALRRPVSGLEECSDRRFRRSGHWNGFQDHTS